LDHQNN